MIRTASIALAIFVAGAAAQAEELKPMQARTIALGDVSGVAYFTVAEGGYEVVATLASGESGTPIRVVATLVSGQKMLVSVPQATDQKSLDVEIARTGDAVFVTHAATLTN